GQEMSVFDALGLVFEHVDEDMPDNLALLLRIVDSGQGIEKLVSGIDNVKIGLEMIAEGDANFLFLSLPQEPVVDEDAGHLRADPPQQERGRDRGIDSARKSANDPIFADALTQLGDRLLDERLHAPKAAAATDLAQKVPQNGRAMGGVTHLGMK